MISGSLRELDLLSPYIEDRVVKALTTLAKYLGVDLLLGRIPRNIFLRHYLSLSFQELRDKILKAISLLDSRLKYFSVN